MDSKNSTSPKATSPGSAEQPQHIRLACQACQRKKIKCDRTFPCGQCTRSSLTCVPSSRKQRMRHAGKRAVDGELRNRIAKLESLVESLSGEVNLPEKVSTSGSESFPTPSRTNSVDLESPAVSKYVASSFWSSLTTEVAALRDVLEEDGDDEDGTPDGGDSASTPAQSNQPDGSATLEHDLIICPPGRIFIMPGAIAEPGPDLKKHLITTFFKYVEPMFKVFHGPTLRTMVEDDAPYLGHVAGSHVHDALKRLIWFAAFNTMQENEVRALTGESKLETLKRHRRFVGIALSQADVLNTSDLATLQCGLFFIAVSRSIDSSRRTWTVLALIVRIAQAMYLHHDDPRATPFMRELKRRLWHGIRFFDKFSALDRGTIPLIRLDESSTPKPTNTNDNLFGPDSTSVPELKDQRTDMTFSNMCFESCDTVDLLILPEAARQGDLSFEERYKLALELGERLEKNYEIYCDDSDPFLRLQRAIIHSMKAAMILRAVRPVQRFTGIASGAPAINSPDVLRLAVDNLTASAEIATLSLEPWKWMRWVPWHPLAVALAGLCSIRGTPLAERAWTLVVPMYAWCSQHVADSQEGMLWRPIAKLYKKALAFRDADPARAQLKKDQAQLSAQDASSTSLLPNTMNPTAFNGTAPNFTINTVPLDNLSSNFSTLDFSMPNGMTMQQQLTTMDDFSGIDLSASLNDASWTDWNHAMDEFADPTSISNGSMDMDIMTNGWTWSGNDMPVNTF